MKTINTNSKEAKQAIRAHIVNHIGENYPSYKELQSQLNAFKDRNTITDYHAAKRLAEGGCLLIYNIDIENFLLARNLTTLEHIEKEAAGKTKVSMFEFYSHLIARELQHAKRWYDAELKKEV